MYNLALKPSPRKWRPEEGEGMGEEWEGGRGVSGRQRTEKRVSRRVAASVYVALSSNANDLGGGEPQGVQQKLNGGELRADASAPT
eukprot:scaffold16470_cov120-Isochrysis_galbana.AAC.6